MSKQQQQQSLTTTMQSFAQQQLQPRHHLPRTVSNASSSSEQYSVDCQQPPRKRQRRRPKHARSVNFAPISKLIILPSKSTRDIQSSWYTEQDRLNFKSDMSHCCSLMRKSSCVDHIEGVAYTLLAKDRGLSVDVDGRIQSLMKQKRHLDSCERIHAQGIEHQLSSTVCRLMEHRRKAVVRRVVSEQGRLRHQRLQMKKLGMCGETMGDAEFEWRMSMALAQLSVESTVFAKEWAMLKLLDDWISNDL